MNFLIVDDTKVARIAIKSFLEGIRGNKDDVYVEAENGVVGLKKITEMKFDFILVDMNMPEMNGIDFVKKLRSIEAYKKTPMIMVTGSEDKGAVLQAVKAGITDYVVKPFDRDNFEAKVTKHL